MNKVKSTIFVLLCCTALSFSLCAQNEILGVWLTEDKSSKVEFYKDKDKYHSKVVWLKEPNDSNGKPLLDGNNPDANLRNKPIVGSAVASDFIYDGKKKWIKGKIYDAESGETHDATFELLDANTIEMTVKVGIVPFREKWTKVR
jgi:uncharacterized protein (DUF2147 family)